MTLQSRILLLNICLAAAVVTGAAFATDTFPGNGFCLMLSFITIAGGIASLFIALLLRLRKDKRPAAGYFLSAAVLLVTGLAAYFFLRRY